MSKVNHNILNSFVVTSPWHFGAQIWLPLLSARNLSWTQEKHQKKKRKVILFEHKYTTDFFSKKFHLITYQGNHLSSLGGGKGVWLVPYVYLGPRSYRVTNNHLAVEVLGTRLPLGFLSSLKLGSHLFYRWYLEEGKRRSHWLVATRKNYR